jgi:quinol monooxygenase YgiN
MIKRIVRMQFRKKKVPAFLELFRQTCEAIRGFEGCMYLELLQDADDPTIYVTLSIWESEDALNHYRNSDLFKDTWTRTKALFSKKPKAWSMTTYIMI